MIIKSEIVSEKSSGSHIDFFFFDRFFFFFGGFSLFLWLGRGGCGFGGLGGAASHAQRSDLFHSGGNNLWFKKVFYWVTSDKFFPFKEETTLFNFSLSISTPTDYNTFLTSSAPFINHFYLGKRFRIGRRDNRRRDISFLITKIFIIYLFLTFQFDLRFL